MSASDHSQKGGDRIRFGLHGAERPYDKRTTAYRGDLADVALAGELFAPHYAEAVLMRCAEAATPVLIKELDRSEAVSELLLGEDFAVLDVSGDTAWGYCLADHYVGFVKYSALWSLQELPKPTHQVVARSTLLFAEPDRKSQILQQLPMGAKLAANGPTEDGQFLESALGFVSLRHTSPLGEPGADIATLAQRLTGAPYIWGGRSGHGLDCSGLVQMTLGLHGHLLPRDCDQQISAVGEALGEGEALQRNDLVYFPDHVGIMVDSENIVHATGHWMEVVTEPLADVVARFEAASDDAILARKRV